jgi:CIC family chloride channel protein
MSKLTRILSFIRVWQRIFANELVRLRMSEHTYMVIVAVLIGILGGFGAVFFRFAIRFFQGVFFGTWHYTLDYALQLPWYVKLFAPAAGGLVFGPIVYYFARKLWSRFYCAGELFVHG